MNEHYVTLRDLRYRIEAMIEEVNEVEEKTDKHKKVLKKLKLESKKIGKMEDQEIVKFLQKELDNSSITGYIDGNDEDYDEDDEDWNPDDDILLDDLN